jgi:hypothetical protein
MADDPLLKLFMPSDTPQTKKPQAKSSKQPAKPADREADPAVRRARDLCDYAYKIMDDIYKDYEKQLVEWEKQFGEILAAVAIANDQRDKTLGAVNEERAQDAARAAFLNNLVFSLLTVGSMAYLGEFVKAGLPKVQIGKSKYDFADSFQYDMYLAERVLVTNKVLVKSPVQFNEFQANVFGDIVKDSGGAFIPLTFPKPPETVPYRVDSPGGLESLRADFNGNVKDSKKLVLGEFKNVQQWLNQESEFGEAWSAYAGGSIELARTEIVIHIEKLRDNWAKKWEIFGKTPIVVSRHLTAELFERAWWATYIIKALTVFPYGKEVTPESNDHHMWESLQLGARQGKLVHTAIVDRLRRLNVVWADSHTGMTEQGQRASRGSPMPEISIDGAIEGDEPGEALAAYRWAKSYVQKASAEAAGKFFPPATPRKLEPLRAARY